MYKDILNMIMFTVVDNYNTYNNICCNYNCCSICPLHKNKYENVNCKIDLYSLASKDNVEIEVEE